MATDVSFAYSEGNPVLPRFSLSIAGGQTVALVGATGAGKSTLAKLIARFYDPSDGVITLDGRDLSSIGDVDFRQAVTLVTQEAYLFSGSIADNIRLGKTDATDDEVATAGAVLEAAAAAVAWLATRCLLYVDLRGPNVLVAGAHVLEFKLGEATTDACFQLAMYLAMRGGGEGDVVSLVHRACTRVTVDASACAALLAAVV